MATNTSTSLDNAQKSADETIANLARFAQMSAQLTTATTGFQFVIKAHEAASQAANSVKNATRIQ